MPGKQAYKLLGSDTSGPNRIQCRYILSSPSKTSLYIFIHILFSNFDNCVCTYWNYYFSVFHRSHLSNIPVHILFPALLQDMDDIRTPPRLWCILILTTLQPVSLLVWDGFSLKFIFLFLSFYFCSLDAKTVFVKVLCYRVLALLL